MDYKQKQELLEALLRILPDFASQRYTGMNQGNPDSLTGLIGYLKNEIKREDAIALGKLKSPSMAGEYPTSSNPAWIYTTANTTGAQLGGAISRTGGIQANENHRKVNQTLS